MIRPLARLTGILALSISMFAVVAGVASATPVPDTPPHIFWTAPNLGVVARTSIETGASTNFASPGQPTGVTIDRETGKLFWADRENNVIYTSAADGSGMNQLSTGAAPIDAPENPAIDARRGRIYWPNLGNNTIGWASTDGSGDGGTLNVGSASINGPDAVAIDPTTDRIYWTNGLTFTPGVYPVGWAQLDGSGTSGSVGSNNGATYGLPFGIAVDPIGQKIYFTDFSTSHLTQMGTDGSGETLVIAADVVMDQPAGLTYDPSTGRLYVANFGATGISWFRPADGTSATIYANSATAIGSPVVSGAGKPTVSGTLSTPVGTTVTQPITITNTGDYALTIFGAGLEKTHTQFKLADGGTCVNKVIVVGGTCTLPITFSPTTPGAQSVPLSLITDAGNFGATVQADGVPTILSNLKTVRRCAAPQNAGALSVKFSLNLAQKLKAKLARQKGGRVPSKCPKRASGLFSGAVATEDSASLDGKAATQTRTLKQIFGTKRLAPGHYRLQLSYVAFDGTLQRRTAWFWALRD